MNKLKVILTVLLIWAQYTLWFGKNGVLEQQRIYNDIFLQKKDNATLTIKNKNLITEINDLSKNLEAIKKHKKN